MLSCNKKDHDRYGNDINIPILFNSRKLIQNKASTYFAYALRRRAPMFGETVYAACVTETCMRTQCVTYAVPCSALRNDRHVRRTYARVRGDSGYLYI